MAGSYPDMPANRLAYHADGSILWWGHGGNASEYLGATAFNHLNAESVTEYYQSTVNLLNNDDPNTPNGGEGNGLEVYWAHQGASSGQYQNYYIATVFPEHRDLYGVWLWYTPGWRNLGSWQTALNALEWSPDTTNGVDGTWNTIIGGPNYTYNDNGTDYGGGMFYRQIVQGFAGPQARGIRFNLYLPFMGILGSAWTICSMIHLFGNINDDLVTERLVWIDESTGLEFDNLLDWGDVPRGTSLTKDIRLKNLSPTYAATSVALDFDALPSPGNSSWYSIKDYGGGYTNGFTITSIAAGATYPAAGPMTIKLTLPAGSELSMDTAWLSAGPPTWV